VQLKIVIMKKTILPALLLSAFFINGATAQTNKAFAITGETKGSFNWTVLREIDLTTGEITKTLYNPLENKSVAYQATIGSKIISQNNSAVSATGGGVAAAAYDTKHNRLYFSQMWTNELRYFDLNSNETKVIINSDINYSTGLRSNETNVITRMAFAADGNGYALTNDGNQLIRFTTGETPTVTNLGALTDGKKNGDISIHSQATSWGGDLIGDVYGNLYLITYKSHVFKINPQTKVAEYQGAIKNLPTNFTTNGAAVDANGDVFISSAINATNYYKVNLSTLDASIIDTKAATVYNISDLANSNLAYQKALTSTPAIDATTIIGKGAASIYPNPAINKTFAVQFQKLPVGNYLVELTDANGRKIVAQNVAVSGIQNQQLSLPKGASAGVYIVNIANANGKTVYTDKVVVQ